MRLTAVVRPAAQMVAEVVKRPVGAGGRMRVLTGFLRSSLMASTTSMPQIDFGANNAAKQIFAGDDTQINLVIAGYKPGQVIYLGFTAAYAAPREYADGFVRLTAQRWPQIVNDAARIIKTRVDARG
jgi:hypothetical protein